MHAEFARFAEDVPISAEKSIRVLCVTAFPDLPEAYTFAGLASRGFEVRVLCSPDASPFALLEASKAVAVPFEIRRRYDRRAISTLRREIATFKPDILHLFNNRGVLNGLRAARGSDAKIIAYRGNVGNVSCFDPLAWLRYLNPRLDRIVCVSEGVREYLAAVGTLGWHLPSEKLVTIHKGHDLAWYTEPPVARVAVGIPRDAFVVGCVANWRPRKGVEVLLEAFARLPVDAPIHLALVGNMANPKLSQRIAAHPRRDRIHLLGFRRDAAAVAGGFDIAVLPAVKREGLPKTVIEAMAYGVATVATRVGGVAELIEDKVSGLIVPPGDAAALSEAITTLYQNPDLRRGLGQRGRERIGTSFRIEDTIAKTARLYETLVST